MFGIQNFNLIATPYLISKKKIENFNKIKKNENDFKIGRLKKIN